MPHQPFTSPDHFQTAVVMARLREKWPLRGEASHGTTRHGVASRCFNLTRDGKQLTVVSVPEPDSWGLMIFVAAMIGAALASAGECAWVSPALRQRSLEFRPQAEPPHNWVPG